MTLATSRDYIPIQGDLTEINIVVLYVYLTSWPKFWHPTLPISKESNVLKLQSTNINVNICLNLSEMSN